MLSLIALTLGCSQPMTADMKATHHSLHGAQDLTTDLTRSLWSSAASGQAFAGMTTTLRGDQRHFAYQGDWPLTGGWSGTATLRGKGAQVKDTLGFHSIVELDQAVYTSDTGEKTSYSGKVELLVEIEGPAEKEQKELRAVVLGELTNAAGAVIDLDYRWVTEGAQATLAEPTLEGTAGFYMVDRLFQPLPAHEQTF